AFLALGPFATLAASANLLPRVRNVRFKRLSASIPTFAATSVFLVFGAYWAYVQYQYFRLLPPDRFVFTNALKSLKANGIVVDSYGAPFGFIAKTWAYMDPGYAAWAIGSHDPGSPSLPQTDYLWFADAKSNKDYQRPEILVCFRQSNLYQWLIDATHPGSYVIPRCPDLVAASAQFAESENKLPKLNLVARDEVDNRWAIYRLQWHQTSDPFGAQRAGGQK